MAIQSKTRAARGVQVTVSFSDSVHLVREQVRWSPKGVSLLTKWPFQVGAEVEFAFDHQNERHCCTGVVVACHPLHRPVGFYETVLFFVETPCSELQKAACDCQLAQEYSEMHGHATSQSGRDEVDGASGNGSISRVRSAHGRR